MVMMAGVNQDVEIISYGRVLPQTRLHYSVIETQCRSDAGGSTVDLRPGQRGKSQMHDKWGGAGRRRTPSVSDAGWKIQHRFYYADVTAFRACNHPVNSHLSLSQGQGGQEQEL